MNNLIELDGKAKEYLEDNNLNLENPKEILDFVISDIQNNILKSELTDAINEGINGGIRLIFPSYIEEQIVNLNNNIYNYGIKEGINKSVNDIIDIGKSFIGEFGNGFKSIVEAQNAISNIESINEISDLLDNGINNLKNSNTVDSITLNALENEKNILLEKIGEKIDDSFEKQIKDTKKLEKYISNWNKNYENKDFSGMEKEYKKIKKIKESVMMTEDILKECNNIENLQELIKNNGKNFDLSQGELELLNKLK